MNREVALYSRLLVQAAQGECRKGPNMPRMNAGSLAPGSSKHPSFQEHARCLGASRSIWCPTLNSIELRLLHSLTAVYGVLRGQVWRFIASLMSKSMKDGLLQKPEHELLLCREGTPPEREGLE
jgi:hypothetical protein